MPTAAVANTPYTPSPEAPSPWSPSSYSAVVAEPPIDARLTRTDVISPMPSPSDTVAVMVARVVPSGGIEPGLISTLVITGLKAAGLRTGIVTGSVWISAVVHTVLIQAETMARPLEVGTNMPVDVIVPAPSATVHRGCISRTMFPA